MKYKLFIADFDGTLGNVPDFIEEDTVKAIKEYEKKGGKFSIITGRSYSSIKAICVKYGIECVVAAFQGARINDLKENKVLYNGGIDYKTATEVIKELKSLGLSISVWSDDILYYTEENFYTDLYAGKLDQGNSFKTPDICKALLSVKKPVSKVCIITERENKDEVCEQLSKKYQGKFIVNSGANCLIEIIDPKLNKGYAVRKIAEYYAIPLNEVLAVGDSTNDLELLQGEWHGVAVGDGSEKLKSIAKEITVDYKDKPVKVLLEKYS